MACGLLVEVEPLTVKRHRVRHQEPERLFGVAVATLHHDVLSLTFVACDSRSSKIAEGDVRQFQRAVRSRCLLDVQVGRVAQVDVIHLPTVMPWCQNAHVEAFDAHILDNPRSAAHIVVHVDANTQIRCAALPDIRSSNADDLRVLQ